MVEVEQLLTPTLIVRCGEDMLRHHRLCGQETGFCVRLYAGILSSCALVNSRLGERSISFQLLVPMCRSGYAGSAGHRPSLALG